MTTSNCPRRNNAGRAARLGPAALAAAALAILGALSPMPSGGSSPARAQTPQQPAKPAHAETCAPRPGRLGVSRIVEIDTASPLRFGQQQYKDHEFLRDGEVVLTFDDGPLRRHSRDVLAALAAHCTQATFFMVGQMALVDPEMVREIARAGHTIGIHTWSHRNLRAAGAVNATREIELGISAVQRALGKPVAPFFRFPYLADSQAMLSHLADRRFAVFSIDLDSRDFRTKDPRTMQRTILDALKSRGKGILLFHDIQTSTARGIAGVLDELASRGYKVVHTVPKMQATTLANYDAMADAELARRSKIAAANPMAARSVVWPMQSTGVPVEQYRPGTLPVGPAVLRAQGKATPPPAPVKAPVVAAPPIAPAPVAPAPATSPAPEPAQASRPALRGTTDDNDWRRNVFQN